MTLEEKIKERIKNAKELQEIYYSCYENCTNKKEKKQWLQRFLENVQ